MPTGPTSTRRVNKTSLASEAYRKVSVMMSRVDTQSTSARAYRLFADCFQRLLDALSTQGPGQGERKTQPVRGVAT